MSDKYIAWDTIHWNLINKRVFKYQQRIYLASQNGDLGKVHFLQKRLVNSLDAKLLSVRLITIDNSGRKTIGLDNSLYLSDSQKSKLVSKLRIDGHAFSIPQMEISKPIPKEKYLLVIRDLAKQALLKLALEPEWEAKFEPNSYGFRPGRRQQDAAEAIFNHIRNPLGNKKYVMVTDLKGCFANLSHENFLTKLNTFSEFRAQISAWLRVGVHKKTFKSR
jgi:RNA-directed DNA polymerase